MKLLRSKRQEGLSKKDLALAKLEDLVRNQPWGIIPQFCKKTGINTEEFYGRVQVTYREAIKDEDFDRIKLTMELTGIEPSDEVCEFIQSRYTTYAENKESNKLIALREASRVPLYDTAQSYFIEHNLATTSALSSKYKSDLEIIGQLYGPAPK